MPSGAAAAGREVGGLRGVLLLRAGSRARAGGGEAAAVHVVERVCRASDEARTARGANRRPLPRPRRREPARRPGGGSPRRCRLLRKEHARDHAPARLVGRARGARHRRGDRADAAARPRLRRVPALYRRMPDPRARRARSARLDPLPLVLDAVSARHPGGVPGRVRGPGLRLRRLPGRLPVEPRRGEAPRGRFAAR